MTKAQKVKATTSATRKQRSKRIKAAKAKRARATKALTTCKAKRRTPSPSPNNVAPPPAPTPVAPPQPQAVPVAPKPDPTPQAPVTPPRQPPAPDPVPSVTVYAGDTFRLPRRPNNWIVATYDALVPSPDESYSVKITVDAVADQCWNTRTEGGIYRSATGEIAISPNPPGWPAMLRQPWCTGNARATLYRGTQALAFEDFRIAYS